jgi:putative colanic acid biosynthesis acetyltransferase WcaF
VNSAPANSAPAPQASRETGDNEHDAIMDRGKSPYTLKERILRVLWNYLGQVLFRFTFHNWYGVRNGLLRAFGARIESPVRLRPSVLIEQPWNLSIGANSSIGDRAIVYCLGKVTIGRHVSISQGAHLCAGTHDFRQPDMPLLRPPIAVHDSAWVAAEAFVGPNVVVGEGAILGARGCAMKNLEPWTVYAGNPAVKLKDRPRFTH